MTDKYYENKLYDVIDRLAVQLRVDLETSKNEQRQEIREVLERLSIIDNKISNLELSKINQKTELQLGDKHTIHKLLDFIIKIVGVLIAGMLVLFGIKEKL